MTDNPRDQLGLSDEDFLNQAGPPAQPADGAASDDAAAIAAAATEAAAAGGETPPAKDGEKPQGEQAQEQQEQKQEEPKPGSVAAVVAELDKPENKKPEGEQKPAKEEKPAGEQAAPSGSAESEAKPGEEKPGEKKPEEGEKPAAEGAAADTPPDYENFYKTIMAPFTANGKKIELKDPAEAIQLMQMGANYTQKLQQMAPGRKILTMLGNHNLLDESKLSFFIALDKGDPEAIKKLIVDKGIDPLDIDTKIEPAYQEGSYAVSDQEVAFGTQIEELGSSDEGKLTLQAIHADWDQASKDMLWQHPEVMSIIHEQRTNGIYAKIDAEMNRLKTLGKIAPTTPFLEAYKMVGDQLQAAGAFGTPSEQGEKPGDEGAEAGASGDRPAPQALETRAAEPRPSVDNGDKAGAASPSRSAPGAAKEVKNFLAMSDDDFMKAEAIRTKL